MAERSGWLRKETDLIDHRCMHFANAVEFARKLVVVQRSGKSNSVSWSPQPPQLHKQTELASLRVGCCRRQLRTDSRVSSTQSSNAASYTFDFADLPSDHLLHHEACHAASASSSSGSALGSTSRFNWRLGIKRNERRRRRRLRQPGNESELCCVRIRLRARARLKDIESNLPMRAMDESSFLCEHEQP